MKNLWVMTWLSKTFSSVAFKINIWALIAMWAWEDEDTLTHIYFSVFSPLSLLSLSLLLTVLIT